MHIAREALHVCADDGTCWDDRITVTHPDGRTFAFFDGAEVDDTAALEWANEFFTSGMTADEYAAFIG